MLKTNSWGTNALREEIFARNVSSLAALVWLIWEYIITFYSEYQYIWRGSMNRVKVLYLFSRYLAICSQIANTYIVFSSLSRLPVPRNECLAWLIFLIVSACLLLAAVDIVIMLRVYALYNCDLKIAVFLSSLLLLQAVLVTICTSITVPRVPFGPNCDVLKTPPDVGYFMATVVFSHTALLLLTIRKRRVAFGQSPVVELVVRDGAWVFVLIVSMFMVTIPYPLFVKVAKPYIMFVLPITLLSITACRLILSMQKVVPLPGNFSGEGATDTSIAFTSYIDSRGSSRPSRDRTVVPSDSYDLRLSVEQRPDDLQR